MPDPSTLLLRLAARIGLVAFAATGLWCGTALPSAAKPIPAAAKVAVAAGHQIAPAEFTLAPFAHARFCVEYKDQCKISRRSIRKAKVRLTPRRLAELGLINTAINEKIHPKPDAPGLLGDRWVIEPARGDCDDYAVTKRARLLANGWPSRALLLAAAVLPDGQNHLVLIVRSSSGDMVLDNLSHALRPVTSVRYRWQAIQDEANPVVWRRIDTRHTLVAVAPINPLVSDKAPAIPVVAPGLDYVVMASADLILRGTIAR